LHRPSHSGARGTSIFTFPQWHEPVTGMGSSSHANPIVIARCGKAAPWRSMLDCFAPLAMTALAAFKIVVLPPFRYKPAAGLIARCVT
jgi:hypothetical protein